MRTAKLATAFALIALPVASAMADGDFWRDVISSGATTASTYLTFKHDKLIVAAQDDASAFVASDGAIRGPYLEAALTRLRSDDAALAEHSDMELANAILTRRDDASAQ